LETGYAGMLRVLVNHGRNYLGPDELDAAVAAHLSDYYRFLGRSVLRPMGREVLEYHRGQLAELGFGFAWGRLVLSALGGLLMAGLSPRKTMETLRHLGQPEGVGGPGSEAQVVSEVPVARPPAESTP
jgi:hypothetical protein